MASSISGISSGSFLNPAAASPAGVAPVAGASTVNPAVSPDASGLVDGFSSADPKAAVAARAGLAAKQQTVDELLKQLSAIQPGTPRWKELKKFAGDATPAQIQAEIGKYRAEAQKLLVNSSNISPNELQSLLASLDGKFRANLAVQGALYDTQNTTDPNSKQSKALGMWCDDPVECGVAADAYKKKVVDIQKQLEQGKLSADEVTKKLADAKDQFHTDLMIRKNFGMKAFQTRLKKELEDMDFAGKDDTSF